MTSAPIILAQTATAAPAGPGTAAAIAFGVVIVVGFVVSLAIYIVNYRIAEEYKQRRKLTMSTNDSDGSPLSPPGSFQSDRAPHQASSVSRRLNLDHSEEHPLAALGRLRPQSPSRSSTPDFDSICTGYSRDPNPVLGFNLSASIPILRTPVEAPLPQANPAGFAALTDSDDELLGNGRSRAAMQRNSVRVKRVSIDDFL
jgi:hypothetical protein